VRGIDVLEGVEPGWGGERRKDVAFFYLIVGPEPGVVEKNVECEEVGGKGRGGHLER
jgi:hypothetical protein